MRALTIAVWMMAGFLGTILAINLMGAAFSPWMPTYNTAQGAGSLIFFVSLLLAPLGALFGARFGSRR